MKIPRVWYMYYGLAAIWFSRQIRRLVRQTGEWMKVRGRMLVAWGDETTPRWGTELFQKCYLADAEIHLPGEVYRGSIDAIYQKHSGKNSVLVVKLKLVLRKRNFSSLYKAMEVCEFKLIGYGAPVVIKEDGYHCVWSGFKNGHLAIYFERPFEELSVS